MSHHDMELQLILERWQRILNTHPEARNHPHRALFPSQHTYHRCLQKRTHHGQDREFKETPTWKTAETNAASHLQQGQGNVNHASHQKAWPAHTETTT